MTRISSHIVRTRTLLWGTLAWLSTQLAFGAVAQASCLASELTTVRDGRIAARAFWAVVAIAFLLAQHQRQRRRRPRGVTPSRRFRL